MAIHGTHAEFAENTANGPGGQAQQAFADINGLQVAE
jgi:hypothetical protein